MKVLVAGAAIALLATVSASLAEKAVDKEYEQRKLQQLEAEKEYQRMLKLRTPTTTTQTPKADPWGNVRTPDKNSK
jgi:hypothetical protein